MGDVLTDTSSLVITVNEIAWVDRMCVQRGRSFRDPLLPVYVRRVSRVGVLDSRQLRGLSVVIGSPRVIKRSIWCHF